jgi:hypothetical protein
MHIRKDNSGMAVEEKIGFLFITILGQSAQSVSAVSSLSSWGTGLYSAALISTQLWLLWPCGALYRNSQPVQLAQGLLMLPPLVGSGIWLAHRQAEWQVEEVVYQSKCKQGVVNGFYMCRALSFDWMHLQLQPHSVKISREYSYLW